jgi:hypothetical protein
LPKIDVPEYAKAQRLSEQDTTLLLESGSWVLSDHAPDVTMSGLEEAALRKLLQVELRIRMLPSIGSSRSQTREIKTRLSTTMWQTTRSESDWGLARNLPEKRRTIRMPSMEVAKTLSQPTAVNLARRSVREPSYKQASLT